LVTATLARGAGPFQWTTSVTVASGVATFTNLADNKADDNVGSGYTLQVSSGGLTPATTSPFNVVSSATSTALAMTTMTGHQIRCWRRWCSTARLSGMACDSRIAHAGFKR
jgi:hypothetical protein